jgi:hypothetical protein
VVVVLGKVFFNISPKISDTDTKVLQRTIQEICHDVPDGISRQSKLASGCLVVLVRVCGRALIGFKMINELRKINSERISFRVFFLFVVISGV